MDGGSVVRNQVMYRMRAEEVTKDDGRYVIYCSWPEDEADYEKPTPRQQATIGVTLHHPHGQIYAYSYIPPADRARGSQRH